MAKISGAGGAFAVSGSPVDFTNLKAVDWSAVVSNPLVDLTGFGDAVQVTAADIPGWTMASNHIYRGTIGAVASIQNFGPNAAFEATAFDITITQPVADVTSLTDSWMEFTPTGAIQATGSIAVAIDSAQAATLAAAKGASPIASADITLTGTLNDTITVDLLLGSFTESIAKNGEAVGTYQFTISDTLTFGSASFLTGFTAIETTAGTITATAASGRTLSGDAWLASAAFSAAKGGASSVALSWQGTGALTSA